MFPINGRPGTEMILEFEILFERHQRVTKRTATPTSTTGTCCPSKYGAIEPIAMNYK
jgi:hypothetical protein